MAPGEALVTGWFGLRWAYLGHYGHSYSSFHIMLIHFVSLTFPDYPILSLYKMENCLDKTCKHENSFQSEKMWKVSTTSPHTALPCIKWKTIEKQWVPVGVWSLLSSILSWSARRRQWQWLLAKHWLPGDLDWLSIPWPVLATHGHSISIHCDSVSSWFILYPSHSLIIPYYPSIK